MSMLRFKLLAICLHLQAILRLRSSCALTTRSSRLIARAPLHSATRTMSQRTRPTPSRQ